MTSQPLLTAGPVVQIRTLCAGARHISAGRTHCHAMPPRRWRCLGSADDVHRCVERIHSGHRYGLPFSTVHVLCIVTVIGVPRADIAARRGDIAAHRRAITALLRMARVGAGLLTLLPTRILGQALFAA
jgi:uncharacterized membrane protein